MQKRLSYGFAATFLINLCLYPFVYLLLKNETAQLHHFMDIAHLFLYILRGLLAGLVGIAICKSKRFKLSSTKLLKHKTVGLFVILLAMWCVYKLGNFDVSVCVFLEGILLSGQGISNNFSDSPILVLLYTTFVDAWCLLAYLECWGVILCTTLKENKNAKTKKYNPVVV